MISRDKFRDPNFNEIDFYLSVKDLDLELIQEEIKKIQSQVLDQVQDYVNQEYLNFLSLSRDLDFVDEELVEYSRDFYQILDKVQAFDQNLEQSCQEAINVLKTNSELRIQKEIQKYDSLVSCLPEVKEFVSQDLLKGIVLFKEIKDFEKLSIDLPEKQIKDLQDVQSFIRTELDMQLQKIFTLESLKDDHEQIKEDLTKLFIGITMMESFDLLSSNFRNGVIEKWIFKSMSRFLILSDSVQEEKNTYSGNRLDQWFREFLAFLQEKVLFLVQLTDKMFYGKRFSLLTDAVWPALVDHLQKMTNIRNPAHSQEFHINYSASIKFIKDFEELFSDANEIVRWKNQDSFVEFCHMWQLPVYYQIRIKEIQEILENGLELKAVESKHGLSIQASQALLNGIESLWAPDIFLYGLQYRALKATFNFLSIYVSFICDILKEDSKDTSRNEDTFIASLLILYNDLQLLTTPLLSFAKSWPMPTNLNDQTLTEVEKSWKKDYLPLQSEIQSKIVNLIFAKCNEVIKQVRIIPSQFRGTQKETPTKSSLFLTGILMPISNFEKMHHSSIVPVISQKIISQVISRYEDIVSETLNSVSNIEAGLRRFKRTKNVSDVSDEDKIRRQLEIDAEEFKQLVANFNIGRSGA